MFNNNKQKLRWLVYWPEQGCAHTIRVNTIHSSKSESLSNLDHVAIDALAFAAATLGGLELAIVSIAEGAEYSDVVLSSLPKLDSEAESFFFFFFDAFFPDATGSADFDAASFDVVDFTPAFFSESGSFFLCFLDSFVTDATGLADFDAARFDVVALAPALALDAGDAFRAAAMPSMKKITSSIEFMERVRVARCDALFVCRRRRGTS